MSLSGSTDESNWDYSVQFKKPEATNIPVIHSRVCQMDGFTCFGVSGFFRRELAQNNV